jgi:hypothetical protein
MEPDLPRALLWQPDDYPGKSAHLSEDGRPFIDMHDMKKLRARTSFHRHLFIGTQDEWVELGLPNWRNNQIMPVVGYEHLFLSVQDERRENRAKALIAAADEYEAAWSDANIRSGYRAAEAEVERIYEQMDGVFDRMLRLRPTTLEGYRAKAVAVFHHCWCGSIDEGSSREERMIASMLGSLIGDEKIAA